MAQIKDMEAFVIWLKLDAVGVFCPLCCKVEKHTYPFKDGKVDRNKTAMRKPMCNPSGPTYKLIFPWERGLGWEKNWVAARLDVMGLDLSELEVEGAWDPANFEIPPPPAEGSKTARGQLGIKMAARVDLGDMGYISSNRFKMSAIKMMAPHATFGGVHFSEPIAVISAGRSLLSKTTGILDRRGSFPPIFAISGWKDSLRKPKNTLKQELWVEEVFKLCDYIGHKLKLKWHDKTNSGHSSASHVEKQLIAFFVRIHLFLDNGFEHSYMRGLESLLPHVQEVWIGVDKEPCSNCTEFRDKVEAVCKVKIHFVKMRRETTYLQDQDIHEPRTPTRTAIQKFSLLTPSDTSSQLSEDNSAYFEDEAGESSDYYQIARSNRNLRFLGTPRRPINIPEAYGILNTPVTTTKRRRIIDDRHFSPPSSPARRSWRVGKRSWQSEAQPIDSPRSLPQDLHAHSAHERFSNANNFDTADEAEELMVEDEEVTIGQESEPEIKDSEEESEEGSYEDVEDETEDETEEENELEIEEESEEEVEEVLPEKIMVDLTIESEDDTEGSIFSP